MTMAFFANAESEELTIRQWSAHVGEAHGVPGRITISVADFDKNNPVLTKFIYQHGDKEINLLHLEEFKRLTKNKLIADQTKTNGDSFFRLKLKYDSILFNNEYYKFFRYKPQIIEFGIQNKKPFIHAIESGEDGGHHGLEATISDSSVKDYALANSKPAKAFSKISSEERITNWTAAFPHPETGHKVEIIISVFDAKTNPALIEFKFKVGTEPLFFEEIEKFEVMAKKPGTFRINFNPKLFLTKNKKSVRSEFSNFLPYLPKSLTFSLKDKTPEILLESALPKNKPIQMEAERKTVSTQNFRHSNDTHLVLEPSTIHSIPFKNYFSPKGIHFPLLKNNKKKHPDYGFKQTIEITKIEELKLGPLLKGKESAVWELLKSTHKPSLSEFLNAIGVKPNKSDKNPFSEYARNSKRLRDDLETQLPMAIAQFEKAFPNAIWYALGRDIYLFGDAMDAYFLYKGEKDRVLRLHASQPSFNEKDPQEVIDFLKTNGFEFDKISSNTKPRVIFDITSYSKGFRFSQSSQLMRAAYMEWERLQRDPHDLLSKVNFVSVSPGIHNVMITPSLDIKDFFETMKFDPPAPKKILQVDGPMSLQYPLTWHDIYRPFKRNPKQKSEVASAPGEAASNSDKLAMLAELWDVAAVVMTGDFSSAVEKKIKLLNDPKAKHPKSFENHLYDEDEDWIDKTSLLKKCDDLLKKPIGSD